MYLSRLLQNSSTTSFINCALILRHPNSQCDTFERGKKRQARLAAAQDQTAVTRYQVADAERTLSLAVAQQFINVLLAESNLQLRCSTVGHACPTRGLSGPVRRMCWIP